MNSNEDIVLDSSQNNKGNNEGKSTREPFNPRRFMTA